MRKAAGKLLDLLQAIDLTQLWKHPGLHFEKLHNMKAPSTGEQLYSLRVTSSARAIACLRKGPYVLLVSLHVQHGKAYR